MTQREKIFCNEFCKTGNATKAAKSAGYSNKNATQYAYRIMQRPHIVQKIAEIKSNIAKASPDALQECIAGLLNIAKADLTKFLTVDSKGKIAIKDISDIDNNLVSSISHNSKKGLTISSIDKQSALSSLARILSNEKKITNNNLQVNINTADACNEAWQLRNSKQDDDENDESLLKNHPSPRPIEQMHVPATCKKMSPPLSFPNSLQKHSPQNPTENADFQEVPDSIDSIVPVVHGKGVFKQEGMQIPGRNGNEETLDATAMQLYSNGIENGDSIEVSGVKPFTDPPSSDEGDVVLAKDWYAKAQEDKLVRMTVLQDAAEKYVAKDDGVYRVDGAKAEKRLAEMDRGSGQKSTAKINTPKSIVDKGETYVLTEGDVDDIVLARTGQGLPIAVTLRTGKVVPEAVKKYAAKVGLNIEGAE